MKLFLGIAAVTIVVFLVVSWIVIICDICNAPTMSDDGFLVEKQKEESGK